MVCNKYKFGEGGKEIGGNLTEVWSALRIVRSLRFEASGEATTGWNGTGVGTVGVAEPEAGVLMFKAAGEWQSPGGPKMRFTNFFRWTALDNTLRLEHLRFGPAHPVFLFDMAMGARMRYGGKSTHTSAEKIATRHPWESRTAG